MTRNWPNLRSFGLDPAGIPGCTRQPGREGNRGWSRDEVGPIDAAEAANRSVDPFLDAKLHRPPVREDWVERSRLRAQLDDASKRPVVLISAAAGYGKTTLVAQWLAAGTSERRAAWVSLDAGDNDPGRLWTHIGTALERVGCAIDAGAVDLFVSTNINSLRERVLPAIVNALAAVEDDVFILLDDFHFVSDEECHGQVEFLIENLPPRAHLVIITRADPGLRLGRLRASGSLAEIRAHDLSFDDLETSQMMALQQVPLSSDGIARLIERTEGWPAGIYLARLWLSGNADPDDAVRQFTGGNRFIGDYLTEEVLSQHAHEIREFIVTMSFLDRFSAPLCDFVRQTTGSAAILHELERSNLFLIPLDEERHWFRFHHLFAAVASGELEADHPDQVPELHARAAQWFRDHDHIDDAVRHFLAAGDTAGASATRPDALVGVRRRRTGRDRPGVARCLGQHVDGDGSGVGRGGGVGGGALRGHREHDAPPGGARGSPGLRPLAGWHPVGGVGDRDDPGSVRLRRAGRDGAQRAACRGAGDRWPIALLRGGEAFPGPHGVRLGRPRGRRQPADTGGLQRGCP